MNVFENSAGLSVNNHYGVRELQDGVVGGGKLPVHGSIDEVVVYVKGSDFGDGTSFDTRAFIPAGAVIREVIAEVTEAFVLGGTSPTINVGSNGTETVNRGLQLSEANAEAAGTYEGTPAGAWASVVTADQDIGVALGGTSPTVTDAGECKVVIRYSKI